MIGSTPKPPNYLGNAPELLERFREPDCLFGGLLSICIHFELVALLICPGEYAGSGLLKVFGPKIGWRGKRDLLHVFNQAFFGFRQWKQVLVGGFCKVVRRCRRFHGDCS